jgi:hypothetical protein
LTREHQKTTAALFSLSGSGLACMLFVVKGLNPETGSTTQLLCCVAAIPCYPSTGSNDPAHQELKKKLLLLLLQ